MATLILPGDNITYKLIELVGENSPRVALADTGTGGFVVDFLGLIGTTSVSIFSEGDAGGHNTLHQLAETNNVLTTVTIKRSRNILFRFRFCR